MSFSIGENEMLDLNTADLIGHYSSWNYFQSIESEENKIFVDKFQKRYGSNRVTSDPMESAYIGVHLWADAVAKSGSDKAVAVRKALKRANYFAPEGHCYHRS